MPFLAANTARNCPLTDHIGYTVQTPGLGTKNLVPPCQRLQPLGSFEQDGGFAEPAVLDVWHELEEVIEAILDHGTSLLLVANVIAPLLLLRQLLAPRTDGREAPLVV